MNQIMSPKNMVNIMKIKVDDIEPNSRNPNVMWEVNFEKLKREIAFTNSNQAYPIIIRKHPVLDGKFEIVDWEHRRKAMKQLGIETIWCDVQVLKDKDARLKTIKTNKFRWEADSLKLAELISDLKNNYWVTDVLLEKELWYTEAEIFWFESLLKFDFDQFEEKVPDIVDDTDDVVVNEIHVSLNNRQERIINELVDKLWLSKWEAIAMACKYLLDSLNSWVLPETSLKDMQDYIKEEDEVSEELVVWPEEEILDYDELLKEIE